MGNKKLDSDIAKRIFKLCQNGKLKYENVKGITQDEFDDLPNDLRIKVRQVLVAKAGELLIEATKVTAELERRLKEREKNRKEKGVATCLV